MTWIPGGRYCVDCQVQWRTERDNPDSTRCWLCGQEGREGARLPGAWESGAGTCASSG